jgi:acetylornithine/succinyldiaminopimelate/putrescine aminotransferase
MKKFNLKIISIIRGMGMMIGVILIKNINCKIINNNKHLNLKLNLL